MLCRHGKLPGLSISSLMVLCRVKKGECTVHPHIFRFAYHTIDVWICAPFG